MKKTFLFAFFALFLSSTAFASTIERVSVSDAGVEGNGNSSSDTVVSDDGRYVVFTSAATNLVANDTNAKTDIFVYDRDSNTIERVSVSDGGVEGNGNSLVPTISADGRYVAFESDATNLVAGDTNTSRDIFVYDRDSNTIERVNLSDVGAQSSGAASNEVSMSSDGRYVAFHSYAPLVTGDVGGRDIFVRDRTGSSTERVSVTDAGVPANNDSRHAAISDNGQFIAYTVNATNLVAGDTNGAYDIFVYDRDLNTVERVSVSDGGVEGNGNSLDPSISDDGRYVIFTSLATNLVADADTNGGYDIFVYDRDSNTIERVTENDTDVQADAFSYYSKLSSDGRYVALFSGATNLVAGDTNGTYDIFVYDHDTDTIQRVSESDAGVQGNGGAVFAWPAISGDGRYVVFNSDATNLVASDTNAKTDTFIVDRIPSLTVTTTVTNDDGDGHAVVADFPLTLGGVTITSGVATTTPAGTYTLAYGVPRGWEYTSVIGGDCASDGSITLEFGESYTCTLTNDDSPSQTTSGSSGGGSSSAVRTLTPPTITPPAPVTPGTPLTPEERTKLINDIKVQVVTLIRQLVTLLQKQLADMSV